MRHDVFFISHFRNKAFSLHLQWGKERKSASCLEEPSGFLHKEEVPMRQTAVPNQTGLYTKTEDRSV